MRLYHFSIMYMLAYMYVYVFANTVKKCHFLYLTLNSSLSLLSAEGYEEEGVWKPVPGKALLPVLESPPATPTRLTPTPPRSHPPTDASRPSRELGLATGLCT